jgi:hypothetical protein
MIGAYKFLFLKYHPKKRKRNCVGEGGKNKKICCAIHVSDIVVKKIVIYAHYN